MLRAGIMAQIVEFSPFIICWGGSKFHYHSLWTWTGLHFLHEQQSVRCLHPQYSTSVKENNILLNVMNELWPFMTLHPILKG